MRPQQRPPPPVSGVVAYGMAGLNRSVPRWTSRTFIDQDRAGHRECRALKKALESFRQRHTIAVSPISQTMPAKIRVTVASGPRMPISGGPMSNARVLRPNSTDAVVRAQSLPFLLPRATKIHRPAPITPSTHTRASVAANPESNWLAVGSTPPDFVMPASRAVSIAFLVVRYVARSTITLVRLTAAPRYMSRIAFRTEAGTGGRRGSGCPPGKGSA